MILTVVGGYLFACSGVEDLDDEGAVPTGDDEIADVDEVPVPSAAAAAEDDDDEVADMGPVSPPSGMWDNGAMNGVELEFSDSDEVDVCFICLSR